MGQFWENALLLKKPICSYVSSTKLHNLLLLYVLLFIVRDYEDICSKTKILRDIEVIIIIFLNNKKNGITPISF